MWNKDKIKIVIIGIGGIGGWLSDMVCKYIAHQNEFQPEIYLVDGDGVETKNLERQTFSRHDIGKFKADAKVEQIVKLYPNLKCRAINKYVDEENVYDIIGENSIVLTGLDNFASRAIISKRCHKLQNVLLISGGNEYVDGASMCYMVENGIEKHPKLEKYFKEYRKPPDKNPADISCEELLAIGSSPQLVFANVTAAVCMCWMFYNYLLYILKNWEPNWAHHIYFDIDSMICESYHRV